MEMTTKGRQILEKLEPLLFNLQEILNERDSPIAASIRIGSGQIAMSAWLGKVIGGMQKSNANLRFHVTIGIASVLIPLLSQEKLDIAVIAGKIDYPGLKVEKLGRRSTGMWVMAPDRWKRYAPYPRSTGAASLADLINCGPVWTPPVTSRFYTQECAVLRQHGGLLRNVNTCDDSRALGDLIATSGGLGYAQHILIKDHLSRGELIQVPGLPPTGDPNYYFVWRQPHLSPIVRLLIKLAKIESEQLAV
jgi:DNA-binding transcriptional LysR family regulator